MSEKAPATGLRFGARYPATAGDPRRIFAAFICEVDALGYRDHLTAVEGIAFEVVDLPVTKR